LKVDVGGPQRARDAVLRNESKKPERVLRRVLCDRFGGVLSVIHLSSYLLFLEMIVVLLFFKGLL
jgi:hypothetical protein